ncbi:MAG TPA: hypothetical protein VKS23_04070 [Thermoanaerobaculia bacterium]|jgi:polyhydroxyalkanoate synthesis regulator phasin|nr:hypothetical protein [Thermoanaerobaculia bacterium]
MSDSFFDQLKTRSEGFLTEISNNLMANPGFIEVLKKGIAVKEEVDKRVLEALGAMSVATRKDMAKMEKRLDELQAQLDSLRAKAAPRPRARKASGRKG